MHLSRIWSVNYSPPPHLLKRGKRPVAPAEQVKRDLVRGEGHAAPREVLLCTLEHGAAVVGDAHVLDQALLVALDEPVPVDRVLAVDHAERFEGL